MGKCGSKLSKSKPSLNNEELYDYARAVEQFNEISDLAEDYIEQGDLEEAWHRYRACVFIMLKVLKNCPESRNIKLFYFLLLNLIIPLNL